MNILYIGPYRSSSDAGLESLNLLLNLYDTEHSVASRSISYNDNPINLETSIEDIVSKTEQFASANTKFDVLIQHSKVSDMTYSSKIKTHLLLPIISKNFPLSYEIQKYHILQQNAIFMYTNNIQQYILDSIKINKKYQLINNLNNKLADTGSIKNKQFNLGLYKTNKKYYTIIDGDKEILIKNLVISFIKQFHKHKYTLVLFIKNITQNILSQYNEFIKSVYNTFGINYAISQVIIVPIDSAIETSLLAHHTGDIFISLEDNAQVLFADKLNKPIIKNSSKLIVRLDTNNLSKNGNIEPSEALNLETIHQGSQLINNISQIIADYDNNNYQ